MKKFRKIFASILSFVFLFGLFANLLPTINLSKSSFAETNTNNVTNYYYNNLNAQAKKFYTALKAMETNETFKTGNGKYDLISNNVVTEEQVKAFQNGNSSLMQDFGAARDAFMLDNPQIFYVNFDKLCLSLATKGETYIANIDAGRYDNYFADGLNGAILTNALNAYKTVNTYVKSIPTDEDAAGKIYSANQLISQYTSYGFATDSNDPVVKGQIRTSYGCFCSKIAVCEGYAKGFKVMMDKLNIPCVEVVGYVQNDDGGLESHAWNYVQVDNKWYLVDPTFSDDRSSANNNYTLLGSENSKNYIESKTVSNSGYELTYPKLATFDYGKEMIETNISYENSSSVNSQKISFSYKTYTSPKNMKETANLYLVARHQYFQDSNELVWSVPYAISSLENNYYYVYKNYYNTQLYITNQEPNGKYTDTYSSLNEVDIIARSDIIYNEIYSAESAEKPNLVSSTPDSTSILDAEQSYDITFTYDVTLQTKGTYSISVSSDKSSNLSSFVKVENLEVSGKTIKFKFTPSKMYEHDNINYIFTPINITASGKDYLAEPATLRFAHSWTVCSKIYDDGRYYVNAYGSPALIDNQDLSMTNFTDTNGNQVAENQRSQLVLVAKKPSEDTANDMTDSVKEELGNNQILSSSTYEIDLHICGGVKQIPSGSYVKVAFGFPAGYGPNDAGVTFKVYHFKKDSSGKIDPSKTEEIECVVTKYGLIVTLDNFSPFMIVATNAPKTNKTIYAKSVTTGGTISAKKTSNGSSVSSKLVSSLASGDSITYTFTPNSSYKVEYVIINDEVKEVSNNKLTLNYSELSENNELIVSFASENVLNSEAQDNIISLNKSYLLNRNKTDNNTNNNKNNTLVIIFVVAAVVVIVASTVVIFVIKKKKQNK